MKEFLEQEIQTQRNTYTQSYDRMIADFNDEKQLIDDYNGRQLLELIQNADDANSDVIEIDLDEINKTLTISNTGTSFSKEGFQSLMIPNIVLNLNNWTKARRQQGLPFASPPPANLKIKPHNLERLVEMYYARAIA